MHLTINYAAKIQKKCFFTKTHSSYFQQESAKLNILNSHNILISKSIWDKI